MGEEHGTVRAADGDEIRYLKMDVAELERRLRQERSNVELLTKRWEKAYDRATTAEAKIKAAATELSAEYIYSEECVLRARDILQSDAPYGCPGCKEKEAKIEAVREWANIVDTNIVPRTYGQGYYCAREDVRTILWRSDAPAEPSREKRLEAARPKDKYICPGCGNRDTIDALAICVNCGRPKNTPLTPDEKLMHDALTDALEEEK